MAAEAPTLFFNDNTIARDFFSLCAGKLLGKGVGREVYRSNIDSNQVFKVETSSCSFQNILEWEAWDAVKSTWYAKWFAPCLSISPCGTVLLQQYVPDIEIKDLPEDVPAFFTDLKQKNWGILNGQPVCRDYGRTLLMDRSLTRKTRKADW